MFFNRGIGPSMLGGGMGPSMLGRSVGPSLLGRGMGSSLSPLTGVLGASKMNWGSLLTNAQKAVGLINQSIPIFYQFGPIAKNAKTMFRVMNEFNKSDNKTNTTTPTTNTEHTKSSIPISSETTTNTTNNNTTTNSNTNNPRFFI